MGFFDQLKTGVGIDLGTANSLLYVRGEGIVLREPTVIALNNKTGKAIAIGEEAQRMMGRTPSHIDVIRPLVNGVISDFAMTQEILKYFLGRVKKNVFYRYIQAVVAIPTNLTEVERKSVEDAVVSAGASGVHLLEEPIAAALGAGLPIDEPNATMVVDLGGGTTEVAIISMGGVVVSESLKIAGDKLNDDIIQFVRDDYKMMIGFPTAQRIKMEIGSALASDKKLEMRVSGRDLSSGLPKEITIKDSQVRIALASSLKQIVDVIKRVIEKTPPELSGDILKNGIYLSGGGSLLSHLDKLIEKEVQVKTVRVEDPLTCVARGTGLAIENIGQYKNLFALSVQPVHIE